jgi:hypothetical protein
VKPAKRGILAPERYTMTDRELLEAAAKAAGVKLAPTGFAWDDATAEMVEWNPLQDDGDALRLAVKLRLPIIWGANYVIVDGDQSPTVNNAHDPYAATRRAIVRAAAAMAQKD